MISIITFVLTLAVLVLIHEFGHFIAAKKNGVRVEEFGFGFPPRIFGKKIGETLYSINLIPIGGFVKLYGEEQQELEGKPLSEHDKKHSFVYKKHWQKAVIIVAGVCMNIILGVSIYYGLLATNHFTSEPLPVFQSFQFPFGKQKSQIFIIDVTENSPAKQSGLTQEDVILSLNNVPLQSKDDLIQKISSSQDTSITLLTENVRNGVRKTVMVTPKYNAELKRAIIGIGLSDVTTISYEKPVEKLFSGFLHSYNVVAYTFHTFGYFISSAIATKSITPVSQSVSGPVGIYRVVNDIVTTSGNKFVINLLNLIALLSISLAVMNILPFPALDGGRFVFIVYEWISHRKVSAKVEGITNYAGFIFLFGLIILITLNDILKLFIH